MKSLNEMYDKLCTERYEPISKYSSPTNRKSFNMWITPKGKVINLVNSHHYTYIENMVKSGKLNIKLKHKGEDIRKDGMDAGWFRVNHTYIRGSGRLAIEGKEEFFNPKVKMAIYTLVQSNIDDLESIHIVLYNKIYTKAIDKDKYWTWGDEPQDKMSHIPLITESEHNKK